MEMVACALLALMLASGAKAAEAELKGAAGKVDITPEQPAYIAGYEMNRLSAGVHDRLMARCLVLESGGKRIAFVSCDVIGLPRYQIEAMRARIKSVKPAQVYIAATHTHSGPDTLGQWGASVTASGVNQAWMSGLRDKIVSLVDETAGKLQPVALKFASTKDVPRISKNSRVAQILDTELGVMQVVSRADSKPVCTFVNYACHPEVLDTRQITADFPHWLYETVESAGGGVCLYLNGAQGGMVTADFDEVRDAAWSKLAGSRNHRYQSGQTDAGNSYKRPDRYRGADRDRTAGLHRATRKSKIQSLDCAESVSRRAAEKRRDGNGSEPHRRRASRVPDHPR